MNQLFGKFKSSLVLHTLFFVVLMQASTLIQAQQQCHEPLTRPDNRYEVVAGTQGGEVKDTVTGYIWQRCLVGMNWNGVTCEGSPSQMTYDALVDVAANMPRTTASPQTPWRIPDMYQLGSLLESSCVSPAINLRIFPSTPPVLMISGTVVPNNPTSPLWGINFRQTFGGGWTQGTIARRDIYPARLIRYSR